MALLDLTRFGRAAPRFLDMAPAQADFARAVIDGLSRPEKQLPCAFFYDSIGSALFDKICDTPEYYPTRTEISILRDDGEAIAQRLGRAVQLVELGSGSSLKVRLLLNQLEAPMGYVGLDISRDHLRMACERLAADYPTLEVTAICADYHDEVPIPPPRDGMPRRRVGFFPGSTLGNLTPPHAEAFLARWRHVLRFGGTEGGGMLIGIDLRKDPAILEAAYDDAAGITATFNLNLLARINRELDGNFNLAAFRHLALWDADRGCMSMYLVSRLNQIVRVADQRFAFLEGEAIHTEDSFKYTIEGFQAMARRAGYTPAAVWTDPDGLFSLHWLEA
ncbi:L-histidine N(alpha)-methyltransferase [Niveispirillum irakense]|uniref:L-histidine N(alpha)-methyltransferase n=1 Tax=Niveispirillum irakense TaxID=34011 RepID=UPI00041167FA|nr:L-histidine N(alpha)-methyltransferase [Niveispirillum irakense]